MKYLSVSNKKPDQKIHFVSSKYGAHNKRYFFGVLWLFRIWYKKNRLRRMKGDKKKTFLAIKRKMIATKLVIIANGINKDRLKLLKYLLLL